MHIKKVWLATLSGISVAVVGGTVLTGAAMANVQGSRTATVQTAVPADQPGASSVVTSCQAVFQSTTPVTGPESFAPALDAADAAVRADGSWQPFQADLLAYVDAYLAFKDSGWTQGVTEAGTTQQTLAADCAQVGVVADDQ